MNHYFNLTSKGSEVAPKKKAFTLAEALITLAIIGVVAALTIPSIIAETQQSEFKTGLKKAVSVLNSAIALNKAVNNDTPLNNTDLFRFLQRQMNVIKSTYSIRGYGSAYGSTTSWHTNYNQAFYTADGMRFEIPSSYRWLQLHKNSYGYGSGFNQSRSYNCGSSGLPQNPRNLSESPCVVVVDVNGDKGPNYPSAGKYVFSKLDGSRLTDMFMILITDSAAIPYGTAAQRAMYGEDSN